MRKLLACHIIILFLTSCNSQKQGSSEKIPPLYPAPQSVPLNTEEGYIINPVTGDSIQPLVNSLGKIIKTGVPVPVKAKVIHPDSVEQAIIIPVGEPDIVHTNLNVQKIPEKLTIIHVNKDSLRTYTPGVDTTFFILINSFGDTVPTGVPIPAKGRVVPCIQPQPVKALLPRMKDNANISIKYLDVDQGMNSSFVRSIMEDSHGNLWFGTWGRGVSLYNGETYTNFTEKEGLSNNFVRSILEDSHGNLWFGTWGGGVSMYNGETFTHFTEKEGLCDNWIYSIVEDRNGNLWFGTEGGGISKYNGEIFIHFTEKEGLSHNIVWSILEDSRGNLWFGTRGKGVSMYNGKTFTNFTEKEGLSNNYVLSILEDKHGNLWFGTQGGVSMYNGETFTHYNEVAGLSNNDVRSILEDHHGNLWFGTWGGGLNKLTISEIERSNNGTFTYFTEKEGLSNDFVWSIEEDSHGNLWLGTQGGGISIYNGDSFSHFTEKEGISHNDARSIMEDQNANIWFGNWGGGVIRYDGENLPIGQSSFIHFTEENGLSNNFVWSISEDSHGNLWFGTSGGGASLYNGETFRHFTTKEGLSNNHIRSIQEDSKGKIWFGTWGGVNMYNGETFTNFTKKEGLSSDFINSILEDINGNLWFGTQGGGVAMYNGESFTYFSEKEGLSNNSIRSILEDNQGNLWFGTEGSGVSMYNGKSFTHYTEKEGLSDNFVNSIVEDRDRNIWIGTENGINCLAFGLADFIRTNKAMYTSEIKKDSLKLNNHNPIIYTYGMQDGLKGKNFYQNSVLLDSQNRIWWGSNKSLTMLDMNNYKIPVEPPANMQLNQIDINEQFLDYRLLEDSTGIEMKFDGVAKFHNYPLNLELSYDHNHLTFHFAAIDWSAPHKIRYSYKMDGLDDNWSLPAAESSADYRNLPHGSFTFIVQAIGAAQKWSQPFEYSFTISPPWWKTIWFRTIVIILLISIIPISNYLRTKVIIARKKELEEEVKNRTIQLEDANKELEAFSYSVSHDLRAPIRAIDGFTRKLSDNYTLVLDDEGKRLLDIVLKSTKNMGHLIDDLLAFSRFSRIKLESSSFNMEVLVKEVAKELNESNKDRNLKITIKQLPQQYGDRALIRQLIINLLSNSIKFTKSRELAIIEIGNITKDEKNIYYIKDNGVGFNMKYVHKIFDVFQRLHSEEEFEGTGVGLAIVQRIIHRHGGKIWVEAEINKGATFYYTIPNNKE